LPRKKKPAEGLTRFAVHSLTTGGVVCGPYESETDAKREAKRLNREALTGRTAPSESHPHGQQLGHVPGAPVLHDGQEQEYEVRTETGVIL
jgi:hypothetical protein